MVINLFVSKTLFFGVQNFLRDPLHQSGLANAGNYIEI